MKAIAKPGGKFKARCLSKSSLFTKVIWEVDWSNNLVVNEGLQEYLERALIDSTWYLGLTGTTPTPAAGDTMASHGGWTEFTGYDETTRPTWTKTRSAQSVSNSASVGVFTITGASQTIGGAFVVQDNVKAATDGPLLCVAPFSGGDRTGNATGDIVQLIYTATQADDGV